MMDLPLSSPAPPVVSLESSVACLVLLTRFYSLSLFSSTDAAAVVAASQSHIAYRFATLNRRVISSAVRATTTIIGADDNNDDNDDDDNNTDVRSNRYIVLVLVLL